MMSESFKNAGIKSKPGSRSRSSIFRFLLKVAALGLAVLVLAALAWITIVIDPFGWGAVHSGRFTWGAFNSIKAGDQISGVVHQLGTPIYPPGLYRTNMPGGALAECGETSQCEIYRFTGTLFVGGKEAIVISDKKSGRVLAKWVNVEP
jgi:hypothetical protein